MEYRLTSEDVLTALIDRLHGSGRLRVWSVIVTIFGDAVAPRGGKVALATLQEIVTRLRIEPGALRTAMSRLAGDGWVARERQGRNSFFSLDERGRDAFDLATRRIYAAGPPGWDGKWTVAIAPPTSAGDPVSASDMQALGFVRLNGGVYLRPETAEAAHAAAALDGMLVVHGESAEHPEAFRDLWPSAEIAASYRDFLAAYRPFVEALRMGPALSPLDAMAARTLLIHDWRRIVLRDPGLPEALMPESWPGEEARVLAQGIYAKLAEPSERWLDDAELPAPLDAISVGWRRFQTAS